MLGSTVLLIGAALAGSPASSTPSLALPGTVMQQGKGGGNGGGQGHAGAQGHARGGSGHAQTQERGRGQGGQARGRSGGQERGQARGNSRGQGSSETHGRGSSASSRGNSGASRSAARAGGSNGNSGARVERRAGASERAGNSRHADRLVNSVLERGRSRGMSGQSVSRKDEGGRVRLANRRGDVLLDMDRDRVDDLGAWRMRRLGDRRPNGNAPAFCRSGAGHPVWGRQWCLDKGFGLGSRNGTLWSRTRVEDIIFRRRNEPVRLDRGGLIDVLGDIVIGRLALQALSLGYDQPLVGAYVATPSSPQILRVYSGGYPVAEFVDLDRDDRPEVLYVVQPL